MLSHPLCFCLLKWGLPVQPAPADRHLAPRAERTGPWVLCLRQTGEETGSRCWTGGRSKSHAHPSRGGRAALPRSDRSILHFHTARCSAPGFHQEGQREMERWKNEGEASHTGPTHCASSLWAAPRPEHLIIPAGAPPPRLLPLSSFYPPHLGGNQSLNWKRDPGATGAGLTPPPPSSWDN